MVLRGPDPGRPQLRAVRIKAEPEERAAAVVAAAFDRIRTYPIERRARIALTVMLDTRKTLCTRRSDVVEVPVSVEELREVDAADPDWPPTEQRRCTRPPRRRTSARPTSAPASRADERDVLAQGTLAQLPLTQRAPRTVPIEPRCAGAALRRRTSLSDAKGRNRTRLPADSSPDPQASRMTALNCGSDCLRRIANVRHSHSEREFSSTHVDWQRGLGRVHTLAQACATQDRDGFG